MKTTIFKLRNLTIFAVFFALILSTTACRKSDDEPTPPDNSDQVDIYVAGGEFTGSNYKSTVWKNETATYLTDGSKTSEVMSVFVQGNDVYVAGYENNGVKDLAKVWKNNVATTLSSGSRATYARSVFVQNNIVYTAGFTVVPGTGKKIPTIWKDNTPKDLSNNDGEATSVFVQGNDVYVAGFDSDGTKSIGKVWKNGSLLSSFNSSRDISITSVFVQNNNLYVTGYFSKPGTLDTIAKVWVNGVEFTLSDEFKDGEANSVCVKDNIAYVAGYETNGTKKVAKVWKIKDEKIIDIQSLTDGTADAYANSVFVVDNDVYVAGYDYKNTLIRGRVWKNGNVVNSIDESKMIALFSIYVVKK